MSTLPDQLYRFYQRTMSTSHVACLSSLTKKFHTTFALAGLEALYMTMHNLKQIIVLQKEELNSKSYLAVQLSEILECSDNFGMLQQVHL